MNPPEYPSPPCESDYIERPIYHIIYSDYIWINEQFRESEYINDYGEESLIHPNPKIANLTLQDLLNILPDGITPSNIKINIDNSSYDFIMIRFYYETIQHAQPELYESLLKEYHEKLKQYEQDLKKYQIFKKQEEISELEKELATLQTKE